MVNIDLKSFSKIGWFLKKSESKEYYFLIAAFLLLVVISGLVIYSLTFLVSNFADSFTPPRTAAPVLKFDIQGFEKLNLIR